VSEIQLWKAADPKPKAERRYRPRKKKVAFVPTGIAEAFMARFSDQPRYYGWPSHRVITVAAFRTAANCGLDADDVIGSVRRWAEQGGPDWTMSDWVYSTLLLKALADDMPGAKAMADQVVAEWRAAQGYGTRKGRVR
jgi:hypothetical protein